MLSLQTFLDGLTILGTQWPLALSTAAVVCLGCFLVFKASGEKDAFALLPPGLLLIFSLIVRLAFITQTYAPPYFDSVEHYRLIKALVDGLETGRLLETLPGLTPGYYHLGFHLLASLLTFSLRAAPMDVILVLGQVTLAAIPIPLYFILRHETKSAAAAFFGSLLVGFGWFMPGFAVNWGKYPAILGLLVFEIVLGLAYFAIQKKRHRNLWIGVLALGIFISTFIHSRTLILIAISFLAWIGQSLLMFSTTETPRPDRQHRGGQRHGETKLLFVSPCLRGKFTSAKSNFIILSFSLASILTLGILIQKDPFLKLALAPYLENGFWITLIVLGLSPFAWMKFPRGTFFCIFFIFGVFACLFIPFDGFLPGYVNQTVLDRPFVEMSLYFPLSILGGLGLAGFLRWAEKRITSSATAPSFTKSLIALLIITLTGVIALRNYDFYPSSCCNLLAYDDTIAIDWLSRNSPADTLILAASTGMYVQSSGPSAEAVGTDAGIWIPNLADRQVTLMPFDTDFHSPDTLDQFCQMKIDYIYVGGTSQSFDASQIQDETDWYERVLHLPNVGLYRLTGCSPLD